MFEDSFDQIASEYDELFTQTTLGSKQRSVVFKYLDKIVSERNIKNVLELNCGTGEDAIYLQKKGCQVVATDVSTEMLKVARRKVNTLDIHDISFLQMDIKHLDRLQSAVKFDLIFSDFGGFNCLTEQEIQNAILKVDEYLSESGLIVLVMMPDRCILEIIYGMIKINKDLIIRRAKSPQKAWIGGREILTWYYSPSKMIKLFEGSTYKKLDCLPIGFIPSYFSKKLDRQSIIFRIIGRLNNLVVQTSFLSRYSDHYLISFLKRQNC
jgi:SAM-dependent methyltransferase